MGRKLMNVRMDIEQYDQVIQLAAEATISKQQRVSVSDIFRVAIQECLEKNKEEIASEF